MTNKNADELRNEKFNCGRDAVEAVSILSMEEYKNNRDEIPLTRCWWWIRAPGIYQKKAMYVFLDGEIYTEGYKVDSERAGVRPVFRLKSEIAKELNQGVKIKIGKFEATVLDNKMCLLDEIVCNHRFDTVSNNWEISELKSFVNSEEFMNLVFA